jgi:hypothetical protein
MNPEEINNKTIAEVCKELYAQDNIYPYLVKSDLGEVFLMRADKFDEYITHILSRPFGHTITFKSERH